MSDIGLYRFAFLAAYGGDGITTNAGGNDESLGIMHREGFELALRTLHHSFVAVHQIQYVHPAVGIVLNGLGEGMPTGLDELVGVQACTFLHDTVFLMEYLKVVTDVPVHPIRCAVPLNYLFAPFYINGAGLAI